MKKIRLITILTAFTLMANAQLPIMYTQFTFNKAGLNPAASGTEINQENYFAAGASRQWLGYENSPKQNFINFSYTIRPPRSYRYWQNASLYIENDNSGLIGSDNYYGGYTFHLLMRKTHLISFGVYAGMRSFSKSIGQFDPNDPAVAKSATTLYLYPDIIPGVRYSDKKYYAGVAFKQITITRLKDFKGRRIGGPSKLQPIIYFDAGRKIALSEMTLMLPAMAVNLPVIGPPVIDASIMFYYANRVGAGLGVRNLSAASACLQVRIYQNITFGASYSYPIGVMRYSAQNSFEVMVGLVPIGMSTKSSGRHSVARCPSLSY